MWDEFLKILKLYPNIFDDLNTGCTIEDIKRIENIIDIKIPYELRAIYLKNSGQKGMGDGIFKSVSGV